MIPNIHACKQEHNLRGNKFSGGGHGPCFTLLYQDDKCDDACNTRVCGYDRGQCTMNQIIAKCNNDTDAGHLDYSTKRTGGYLIRPAGEIAAPSLLPCPSTAHPLLSLVLTTQRMGSRRRCFRQHRRRISARKRMPSWKRRSCQRPSLCPSRPSASR